MAFEETGSASSASESPHLVVLAAVQAGNEDRIHLPAGLWLELAPVGHELRTLGAAVASQATGASQSRPRQADVRATLDDTRCVHALGYLFETVAANEDGGVQPTYDLSVPENVTYVAHGFVSHNTIGLMMDCDTTGIEPDLALVKFKKLVGGGSMQIVNQTVPRPCARWLPGGAGRGDRRVHRRARARRRRARAAPGALRGLRLRDG